MRLDALLAASAVLFTSTALVVAKDKSNLPVREGGRLVHESAAG